MERSGRGLDPGTSFGYHAIHCAAHGFSTTAIDGSPSAFEPAKRNAERARAVQAHYAQALHRVTETGARLFMFDFSPHNVNGIQSEEIPAENFERVLGGSGCGLDYYLGPTTYQARWAPGMFDALDANLGPELTGKWRPWRQQLEILSLLLVGYQVHILAGAVVASRLD